MNLWWHDTHEEGVGGWCAHADLNALTCLIGVQSVMIIGRRGGTSGQLFNHRIVSFYFGPLSLTVETATRTTSLEGQ